MGTRRTKGDVATIKEAIYSVLAVENPMTVRQVFYQLVSQQIVNKTENDYKNTVGRLLVDMRRGGEIPYRWIADSTRWMRRPNTYDSLDAYIEDGVECYRRSLWRHVPTYVEAWLEKDALAGVLCPITEELDVPLMVTRGYPSITYLYDACETIKQQGKPTYIYYFGDRDPSGVDIPRFVDEQIRLAAPNIEMHFNQVAVTLEQIEEWHLLTRPTKTTDSRSKNFVGESVEVDAIPPSGLRQLVRDCIEQHLDSWVLERIRQTEAAERQTLRNFSEGLKRIRHPDSLEGMQEYS